MKPIAFLLFLSVYFMACSTTRKTTRENLTGNFELSVFPVNDKSFDEIFGQHIPQLQFDDRKKTITGTTGCNRLGGTYTISGSAFSINNNLLTTKMACPGYEENIFLDALRKVNRYEINSSGVSFLHDSILVMSFIKKP